MQNIKKRKQKRMRKQLSESKRIAENHQAMTQWLNGVKSAGENTGAGSEVMA
jgi:hypothetical protein